MESVTAVSGLQKTGSNDKTIPGVDATATSSDSIYLPTTAVPNEVPANAVDSNIETSGNTYELPDGQ